MKKILVAMAAIAAITASADYMYWMVGEDVDSADETKTWATAKLVQSEPGPTAIGTLTRATAAELRDVGTYASSYLLGDASTYNSATFFIELYNSKNEFIAKSDLGSGESLAQFIFTNNSMKPNGATALVPAASTYNVPEPTSGLLFLVGGMLLGLKRRRMA